MREALLNAVSHRNYRSGSSIFVRQYPQRLEVISPGGFPPGVTVENLLDAQNPRNRRLATALQKCGLIERSGQGMNLMFEHAIQQGKALPDFKATSAHEVRLCLHGAVTTPAFVRFIERLGAEKLQSFSTDDFLVLDHGLSDEGVFGRTSRSRRAGRHQGPASRVAPRRSYQARGSPEERAMVPSLIAECWLIKSPINPKGIPATPYF